MMGEQELEKRIFWIRVIFGTILAVAIIVAIATGGISV